MVRSGLSDEERRYWNRVMGVGFVVLVAGSMALVAIHGDASLTWVVIATATGLVVGTVIAYYLSTLSFDQPASGDRPR